MVSLFQKIRHDAPSTHFLFPLASSGPLALQALVMAFAAAHKARMQGQMMSVQSIEHRTKAIQMLKARFENAWDPERLHDETVLGAFGMASLEVRVSRFLVCQFYMRRKEAEGEVCRTSSGRRTRPKCTSVLEWNS